MLNQRSVSTFSAVLFFLVVSIFVFTSCSGGSDNKAAADSTTVQAAPAVDSSGAMPADTTVLDSASTRPVKSPN
ncbi:hypothetical protein FRZ67_20240 [Panacibacter ginsenosidivorans]|uniref:Uncharacterized protein n=1 Tax=Panacibacter ginsenosidivorans TaxID=1813871 RepID=A0A5B8VDA5_9BACT|nr:hypothetical protein [Panacibacter ginsenosidivorans]QEC69517.1 hypothetical protein FRZ67_20240 [Panacibacter ginsenosidivorans]